MNSRRGVVEPNLFPKWCPFFPMLMNLAAVMMLSVYTYMYKYTYICQINSKIGGRVTYICIIRGRRLLARIQF